MGDAIGSVQLWLIFLTFSTLCCICFLIYGSTDDAHHYVTVFKVILGSLVSFLPIVVIRSLANTSVQIRELMKGSLTNEVQRITLRAVNGILTGTFRLEIGIGTRADKQGRGRAYGDHDDMSWTSPLGANSTAEDVRTNKYSDIV